MTVTANRTANTDEAIAELFEAYGDRVYRLGLRLCDQPESAEDLVQETFLRAHRNWGQFRGDSEPLTWLYTIASRACSRMQRKRAGEPRRVEPLSELIGTAREGRVDGPESEDSPLDYAIRRDEVGRLHRAISTLPAAFRLPLVLKDLEGLTVAEVAEILGVREATVKTRLHRARLTLRRELVGGPPLQPADAGTHTARQCADLLAAKLEAMAHGVPFPIENERICAHCHSTLSALDRTRDVCALIPTHPLPASLRRSVLEVLRDLEAS